MTEQGWMEGGVWKPWRHPDYRSNVRGYQGWWRNEGTGDVIAVLGGAPSSSGKATVIAAKYNFNAGVRGNGYRLRVDTLLRDYVQEPDNLNPK